VAANDVVVSGGVLFCEDFYGGEEGAEAGANEFGCLLLGVSFCHQDAAMALGELAEGGVDGGEELNLGGGDGLGEGDDAGVADGAFRLGKGGVA
jgi:hypothetical protein